MGIVILLLDLFVLTIIARVVMSWIDPEGRKPLTRFVYPITEPVLGPVRRFIGNRTGGLDLSPMIVIFLIELLTGGRLFGGF